MGANLLLAKIDIINQKSRPYKISHLTDGDKTTVLTGDAEFVHFMRKIAVENGDEDMSITCLNEAKEYLENYCDNLKLIN